MENEKNTASFGPPVLSLPMFLLKIIAGGSGGIFGSLVILVVLLISGSFLTPLTQESGISEVNTIFIFLLMVTIFLSTTIANILSVLFIGLTDRERYTRLSSAVYQVFIMGIFIFILTAPVYFFASSIDTTYISYALILHIIVSAQVSAMILEIVANYRYSLLGLYGTTFSILISISALMAVASFSINPTIILFIATPIVWGAIAFVHGLAIMLYSWIVRIYDKDFLSTQTLYGEDFGKQVERDEKEEEDVEVSNDEGAEFLKKQQNQQK